MACFLYLATIFAFYGDEWAQIVSEHLGCIAESELTGSDPDAECPLELNIGDSVYFMQGYVWMATLCGMK